MENVAHPGYTFKSKLQKMYKPFWQGCTYLLLDKISLLTSYLGTLGCKAGCFSIRDDLVSANFSYVQVTEITVKDLPMLLSRFHYGIATK